MTKITIRWYGLGLLASLLGTGMQAAAQTAPNPPAEASSPASKVYTYVEQMPALPGGGGMRAVVTAIQQRVHYPPTALRDRLEGRVFVKFVVGEEGQVRDIEIVKGLRADCDLAVVQAVQQLPRFEPGRQAGKPVAVSFTAPITFAITITRLPPAGPR